MFNTNTKKQTPYLFLCWADTIPI